MNLYVRFLYMLIKWPFISKSQNLKWQQHFRVWPHDCDINLHLTNARYFSFADLARTYAIMHMGVLGKLVKRGWLPVVNAEEITFIKPIAPLVRFRLETELLYWDEKYFYIQHHYWVKDKLCAKALIRGVFYSKKEGVVPLDKVLALAEIEGEHQKVPKEITTWKDHLKQKKS
jgi:acyl-CoA thioesterase FadM